jgi:hypothetical protein
MSENISVAKTTSIRDAGYDEVWLQDRILENTSALDLGDDLEVISRERIQSSGGRLDILLKDPEEDMMYEVEVMLGATDETHIVRTIEYWDNEKRKWPHRQHTAVLVAESINRRFFNVIQIFSHAIPIIAIQVSLIDAGDQKLLHFSKILDSYEEPDDRPPPHGEYDEQHWRVYSPWTLETARALLDVAKPAVPTASLNYAKYYIAIETNGNNVMSLNKRSGNKSWLEIWFSAKCIPVAMQLLDEAKIPYSKKKDTLRITTDTTAIKSNPAMLKLAELVKQSWED